MDHAAVCAELGAKPHEIIDTYDTPDGVVAIWHDGNAVQRDGHGRWAAVPVPDFDEDDAVRVGEVVDPTESTVTVNVDLDDDVVVEHLAEDVVEELAARPGRKKG